MNDNECSKETGWWDNIKAIILIVAVLILTAISAYPQSRLPGKVVDVVDGRTVVVALQSGRVTVQLQYIEVPEPEQPLHQIVKDHLQKLLLGKPVEFTARGFSEVKSIGQLTSGGVDISRQMLRDGAAWYAVPEKSGQEPAEREKYLSTEAEARGEKRGIWGIEGLKPAWEFRSEKEESERQREQLAAETRAPKAQGSAMLAATDEKTALWSDFEIYTDGQWIGADGLVRKYDDAGRQGLIGTAESLINITAGNNRERVDFRTVYLYRGNTPESRESVFAVAVIYQGQNFKFSNLNSLTVLAGEEKIDLGAARRVFRRMPTGAQEVMIYEIDRPALTRIVNAASLEIKMGLYSGKIDNRFQALLKQLVQASE